MILQNQTNFDPINKIWYGSDLSAITSNDVSVGHVLLYMLERDCEKIVQISANNDMQFTGEELCDLSIKACLNLQKRGLQQEDVIGVIASNSHYLAPLIFGALLSGIPISTLDPSFDKGEIKHAFGITKPKMVFCDYDIYSRVKESLNEISINCPIYTIKGKIDGIGCLEDFLVKTGGEDKFLPPKLKKGGDQLALILCSSGTTGLPKGVCVSHAMILSQTLFPFMNNLTVLCFSTLYWLTGVFTYVIGTISGAKRIIIDRPFSPELLLELIEKYKVEYILTPPSQMAMALNCPDIKTRDLSSLKLYTCGGSYVSPIIVDQIEKYLKNCEIKIGYGMTEVAGISAMETALKKRGSVGQIAFNMKMKIIDDNGKQLGIGESGEICMKTSYKCFGYYNNIEATKNLFDSDGWVHSGDIGYFDNDGYLFIVDRKKDILKYKNFHFYPLEIENVIRQIPDIVEVCVCGIPDLVATDLPAAAIIKKNNSNLTKQQIYDYVADRMSHFKHLHGGVYFLDELPMTASGKIQRRKVRDILEKLYHQMNDK